MLLLLWCLVRLTSPGPALFRQERVGRDMRPFTMLKLRTMYVGNDDQAHRAYVTSMLCSRAGGRRTHGGLFKLVGDPRVTPARRVAAPHQPGRAAAADQRAARRDVAGRAAAGARLGSRAARGTYRPRFAVKPGITGLWQVSGRSRLSMRAALELDVEYVRRRSIFRDLSILARPCPPSSAGGAS